ncbi:hypothetical protein M3936_23500 [Sutcliffiella horikoshii]|uniref:hypothetical protein n=1 Tax=Sutcliffiella horikoshii TaxID=79883 RepID=UPI00203E19A2|nr:hypothetical protein [Sutcliffiella horikoshii]MCM3620524.1 hypothetical protein [Sutcliffiella horikoshii]
MIINSERWVNWSFKENTNKENYYVAVYHEYADKWQAAGGTLRDYQKWDLYKKAES